MGDKKFIELRKQFAESGSVKAFPIDGFEWHMFTAKRRIDTSNQEDIDWVVKLFNPKTDSAMGLVNTLYCDDNSERLLKRNIKVRAVFFWISPGYGSMRSTTAYYCDWQEKDYYLYPSSDMSFKENIKKNGIFGVAYIPEGEYLAMTICDETQQANADIDKAFDIAAPEKPAKYRLHFIHDPYRKISSDPRYKGFVIL